MAKEFRRGLQGNAINEIDTFFKSTIGQKIKNAKYDGHSVFQTCIRDNYINIYWKGCSVLKFKPNARTNKYEIHFKYVNEDYTSRGVSTKKPYVCLDFVENDLLDKTFSWSFNKNIIAPLKNGKKTALYKYSKREKEKAELSEYIKIEKPFLLDLEVAFSREKFVEKSGKNKPVADRIDMARLRIRNRIPILQLVEVKRVSDSRLRSKENKPEIMEQMNNYQHFLNNESDRILKSYKTIAKNYIKLDLLEDMPFIERKSPKNILKLFSDCGELDTSPYLLILGKRQNLNGRHRNHWDYLNEAFPQEGYPVPEIYEE